MWPMTTFTPGNATASSSIDQGRVKIGWPEWIRTGSPPRSSEQIHERVYGRVVRVVAVDQRMKLETQELRVIEEALDLLDVPGDSRVSPHEPVRLGNRLDDRADVLVVRVKDAAALVAVLLDDRCEAVAVERDVEHRPEVADVHVSVEDHAAPVTGCRDRSAVLGSTADR